MKGIGWLVWVAVVAGCVGEIGESSSGGAPASGGNTVSGTGGGGSGSGAAGSPAGGGSGSGSAGASPDPFAVPATCTSGTMWTQGNHGSDDMNPGRACIACHTTDNGPTLTIGGTVYPTAHEPDLCNGADGSNGARITIVGADGQTLTLTPGASGNFNSRTRVMLPYKAKVSYLGRERAMAAAQTSGDCNSCHMQNGANGAPGRILLP